MKKTLAILLALAILLSLCACGNDDVQTTDPGSSSQTTDSTGSSSESTEKPTDGTEDPTDATQAPTDEPTSAPTEEPTTAPTETVPAACTHSWKDATCKAPKTCSKCGATEGSLAGHSYSNGTCSTCGTSDPNYKQLTEGSWIFNGDGYTAVLTFHTSGIVSVSVVNVVNTVEEFRKTWNEYTLDEYSWYSVYDIGGTHYVAREEIVYDSLYTVDGQTISYEIFDCPESITWDGYTVTAAAQSGSGWMNNMGTGTWSASGVSIIEDLGPYFAGLS